MTEIETKEREQLAREINRIPQRAIDAALYAALVAAGAEREAYAATIAARDIATAADLKRLAAPAVIDPRNPAEPYQITGAVYSPIPVHDMSGVSIVPQLDPLGVSIRYIHDYGRADRLSAFWPTPEPVFNPVALTATTQRWSTPEPPVLPVAHAIAAPPAIDAELLEHERVARKLGVACVAPEIGRARLAEALIDEGITCYDMQEVQRYMSAMAHQKWMTWQWFPARAADVSDLTIGLYDQPIPLPVLMTMGALVERLGDQIQFKIAAFTEPKADPFLAVHPAGVTNYKDWFVIERWDEPSFRGVKA